MTEIELQVRKAREDFDLAAHGACREHLGNLYDLLDDWVGSGARDKCESAEKSNPSSTWEHLH
jgi:hypothetical protein